MRSVGRQAKSNQQRELQQPFDFILDVKEWKPTSISDLPSWKNFPAIGYDLETEDKFLTTLGVGVRRGGRVAGISLTMQNGPGYYLPIGHEGGDNYDPDQVWNYIRHEAKHFDGKLVGANLSYDLDYSMENKVNFNSNVQFCDVLMAEALLDELQLSYSLEAVGQRRIGVGKDNASLINAAKAFGCKAKTLREVKQFIHRMPGRHVAPYAVQDGRLPLQIFAVQDRLIEEQELQRVWKLERELLPILVKMRRRGVRVNEEKLHKIELWAKAKEAEALGKIRGETGINIPVGATMSPDECMPLFKKLGIEVPKTAGGAYSITADWLTLQRHPMLDQFKRARQVAKVQSTYVNGTKEHLVNGRIHCTFNQVRGQKGDTENTKGAAYGRLSCQDPNLQNQPSRDEEIGPMWRDIYEPEEGSLWGSKDYSQQEPKMGIHFAIASGPNVVGQEGYARAKQLAQMFVDNPKLDTYLALVRAGGLDKYLAAGLDNTAIIKDGMTEAEGKSRKYTKELQLGVTYGMGGPKLCGKLGLPTVMIVDEWAKKKGIHRMREVAGPEGQRVIDVFNKELPFIIKLQSAVKEVADRRGYVKTLFGRRCRFPEKDTGGYDWTFKSLNRVIQGSSGDQTKQAIIELDRAGHFIQLQIHDEVTGSYSSVEEGRRAAKIMETCVELKLPTRVDLEMGKSWGTAKSV